MPADDDTPDRIPFLTRLPVPVIKSLRERSLRSRTSVNELIIRACLNDEAAERLGVDRWHATMQERTEL